MIDFFLPDGFYESNSSITIYKSLRYCHSNIIKASLQRAMPDLISLWISYFNFKRLVKFKNHFSCFSKKLANVRATPLLKAMKQTFYAMSLHFKL